MPSLRQIVKIIKNKINYFVYNCPQSIDFINRQSKQIILDEDVHRKEWNKNINECTYFEFPKKIKMDLNKNLPKLAWYCTHKKGETSIHYGQNVFAHEQGIIEGIWDDNFEKLNYHEAEHVFGSGVFFCKEKISFVSPSHLLEGIYLLYDKITKNYYVSNSLVCTLSLYDDHIDISNLLNIIDGDMSNRLKKGIFNYNPILFENDNFILMMFSYHNFYISSNGLFIDIRYHINAFKTFNEYKCYLKSKMQILLNNGSSKLRRHTSKLMPLATISSGYDSAASASILSELGVKDAITIDVNVYEQNDSGQLIAKALEMNCNLCPHPFGEKISDLNIMENFYEANLDNIGAFLATIGMGDDSSWLAFKPYLHNKIVFTGHGGDEIWYKDEFIGQGLRKTTTFELSLGEYRLQQGFARVATPYIGTVFAHYIYRLNFLTEMSLYNLNNRYDRPIPRRLIEERGVSRKLFAQIKRATNPNLVGYHKYKVKSFEKHIQHYKKNLRD